jgi:hypothetical protein
MKLEIEESARSLSGLEESERSLLSADIKVDLELFCEAAKQIRQREWLLGRVSSLEKLNLEGRNAIILNLFDDKLYLFTDDKPGGEILDSSKSEAYELIKSKCGGSIRIANIEEQALINVLTDNTTTVNDEISDEMMKSLETQLEDTEDFTKALLTIVPPAKNLSYRVCFKLLRKDLISHFQGLTPELDWQSLKEALIHQCEKLRVIEGPDQKSYIKLAAALQGRLEENPLCLELLNAWFIEFLKNSADAVIRKAFLPQSEVESRFMMNVSCALDGEQMVITISDDTGGFKENYPGAFNGRVKGYKSAENGSDSTKQHVFDGDFYCGGRGMGLYLAQKTMLDDPFNSTMLDDPSNSTMKISNTTMNGKPGAKILFRSTYLRPANLQEHAVPDSGVAQSAQSDSKSSSAKFFSPAATSASGSPNRAGPNPPSSMTMGAVPERKKRIIPPPPLNKPTP